MIIPTLNFYFLGYYVINHSYILVRLGVCDHLTINLVDETFCQIVIDDSNFNTFGMLSHLNEDPFTGIFKYVYTWFSKYVLTSVVLISVIGVRSLLGSQKLFILPICKHLIKSYCMVYQNFYSFDVVGFTKV